jgi:cytochrome c-type biogenesis protein CcmE
MKHPTTIFGAKLWVGGVILVGAVGYLAYAGMSQGWVYYVSVDQLQGEKHTSRVRLMGTVAEEGIEVNGGRMTAKFVIHGDDASKRVAVDYRGAIPDLFKAGADVVVEGKLNPGTDRFEADVLLTKCASKYEGKHQEKRTKSAMGLARTEKAS